MTRESDPLYRVRFVNQDKIFEIYAEKVHQGELFGFVTIESIVFGTSGSVVVDPAEERLKREFEGVRRSMIPMHAVLRIDVVEKRGTAKIREFEGKIAQFPSPIYTPSRSDS